jgi:hemerythrin
VSIHVLTFLKDWLTHHIMGTDKQYSPWLARAQS